MISNTPPLPLTPKTGVLLLNIGTPDKPDVRSVKRYLKQFLSDERIIDIHPLARWFLVNVFILPFRSKRSAAAYQVVWQPKGSPLTVFSQKLLVQVANLLGEAYQVELGMRYGNPSIPSALDKLMKAGCDKIIVLPLFPQYSAAATGSAVEAVFTHINQAWNIPAIEVRGDFYNHTGFIRASATLIQASLRHFKPDFILFSYHGLPVRHIEKSEPNFLSNCDKISACPAMTERNRFCYRAQCFETSRLLAENLGILPEDYAVSFQSRLGRTPWIRPYTDEILRELANRGVKNLLISCPSFVSDCLETLEEIGIRAKAQWLQLGGKELLLIPCLNDHPLWVETVVNLIKGNPP